MNKVKFAIRQFLSIKPVRDRLLTDKYITVAAIAVVLSQLADFTSTWIGFQHGAREGNGAMAHVITQYGFTGFLAAKLLGAGILVYMTWRRKYAPWIIVAFYGSIAIWNLALSFKLSR